MMPCVGKSPLHCRRFVYGYRLDGSDFPCYFLWPHRAQENNFWLLESQTHRYVDLSLADFLQPLGKGIFMMRLVCMQKSASGLLLSRRSSSRTAICLETCWSRRMLQVLVGGRIIRSNRWIRMRQRLPVPVLATSHACPSQKFVVRHAIPVETHALDLPQAKQTASDATSSIVDSLFAQEDHAEVAPTIAHWLRPLQTQATQAKIITMTLNKYKNC